MHEHRRTPESLRSLLPAATTGRRIVDMVWHDLRPADILSEAAGFGHLHRARVLQADEGRDLDFLRRGEPTPKPEIH